MYTHAKMHTCTHKRIRVRKCSCTHKLHTQAHTHKCASDARTNAQSCTYSHMFKCACMQQCTCPHLCGPHLPSLALRVTYLQDVVARVTTMSCWVLKQMPVRTKSRQLSDDVPKNCTPTSTQKWVFCVVLRAPCVAVLLVGHVLVAWQACVMPVFTRSALCESWRWCASLGSAEPQHSLLRFSNSNSE